MYSHEITEYLNKRNYELTPKEFVDVINSSPQVNEVLYRPENNFKLKTTDNYNWQIKLKESKKLTLKKKDR